MTMTIEIQTEDGAKEVAYTAVSGCLGVTHIDSNEGQPCRHNVTHAPTGMAFISFKDEATALATARMMWSRVSDATRDLWATGDAATVGRETPREVVQWLRACRDSQACVAWGETPEDDAAALHEPISYTATNKHTRETREVTTTLADLQQIMMDASTECVGPCQCEGLEADATCSHGWPALGEDMLARL